MEWFELVPGLSWGGEIACLVLLGVFAMVASAGGVGGGPINVSVLLILGATAHIAIPLSKAVIFGGSLILMIVNMFQRSHDDPDLPVVQWDFVFVMEPAAVVGAFVGAVINSMVPDWLLTSAEALLLTYIGITMLHKGVKTCSKERELRAAQAPAPPAPISSEVASQPETQTDDQAPLVPGAPQRRRACSTCAYIHVGRMVNFSVSTLLVIVLTIVQNVLPKCSPEYWAVFALGIVVGLGAIGVNAALMNRSFSKMRGMMAESSGKTTAQAAKECKILMGSSKPEAVSSLKFYFKFAGMGVLAGLVAAALGVGGGMFKNPVLMAFGIDLYTARAASGTMIAFTSLSSMVTYLSLGQISISYAWPLMAVVAVTFPAGYFISDWIMRLIKSRSIIPFAMAAMLLVSDVFIIYNTVESIVLIARTGVVPGFTPFC